MQSLHKYISQQLQITGPQMKPAIDRIKQWKHDMGLAFDDVWAHCNAHIEPALAGALTKVLLDIEEVLGKLESPV
jgi:hypothetical protein